MTTNQETRPKTMACSVFSPPYITYDSLLWFERVTTDLVESGQVRRFYIVAEYWLSPYMQLLEQLSKSAEIEIIGVTGYTDVDPAWLEAQYREFIPPFHRIENIDTGAKDQRIKNLRKFKRMIDRADFCICDLSKDTSTVAQNIRSYVRKRGGITMLDFGENRTEPPQLYKIRNGEDLIMCRSMEEMRNQTLRESLIAVALRMLKAGRYTLEEIAECVGLPLDEVKKLSANKTA